VHSYCVIPSNIPFVIQRGVLVCEQSDRRHDSLQTYISTVDRCFLWRIRTPNALVRRHSKFDYIPNSCVTCFWLHAQVYWRFVVYLNITERNNQLRVLLESYQRTKWWEPFICLALAWQLQDVRLLSWRPTCAPATTRLTPQLVGTSAITYNLSPYTFSCMHTTHKFENSCYTVAKMTAAKMSGLSYLRSKSSPLFSKLSPRPTVVHKI